MQTLNEAATELREMASRLDKIQASTTIPKQNITVQDAARQLRAALGDNYFSIEMRLDFHCHQDAPDCKWLIWDGKDHHKAKSLAAVLSIVLSAHSDQPADPVDNADMALQTIG